MTAAWALAIAADGGHNAQTETADREDPVGGPASIRYASASR